MPRDNSLTESSRVNIAQPAHPAASRRMTPSPSPLAPSPKEAQLETPREAYSPNVGMARGVHVRERDDIDAHLEQLFVRWTPYPTPLTRQNTLQVPDSVRQKFTNVSPDVKSSILSSPRNPLLSSSHTPEKPKPNLRKRLSQPLLRKARSSSSLGSPGTSPQVGRTYRVDGEAFTIVASPPPLHRASMDVGSAIAAAGSQSQSQSQSRPATVRVGSSRPSSSFALFGGGAKSKLPGQNPGLGIAIAGEQPESFIAWLSAHKATDLSMDVDRMKKLRMLLRHEKTEWVAHFLDLGGYALVLARLQDLLSVEWR